MKVMISQPMKDKSEKQIRTEREELVEELTTQGYNVIDTIFKEEPPANCNVGLYYLAKSIEALSKVDGLVCMQGWEKARGCRIEEQCAREYGKFVMYL